MRILMAASEFSPLARSGGLADSVAGLAGALARRGHEVCVVLPAYRHAVRALRRKLGDTGLRFTLPLGPRHEEVAILDALGADGVQIFLVKHDPFFDRAGLYGEGGDYPDNAARFILFAKAAAHLAGQIDPAPDIVHAHDWQAALVPLLLSREPARPRTVLSLHNVAYQGLFPGFDFPLTNLPAEHFGPDGLEFYGQLNLLKGGIASADALTTVSEVYRREILGPGGCGLEGLLQRRAERLYGFLDGADYAEWDPSRDPHLPKRYRPAAPAGKRRAGTRSSPN